MARAKSTSPSEPTNSEQLEALEASRAPSTTDTTGELEERAVEAEGRAEAAERRVLDLQEELRQLTVQVAALMRANAVPRDLPPPPSEEEAPRAAVDPDVPVFDPDLPHGLVTGDSKVGYVQDGHQFGHDRRYLATEKHRGSPRAFNPRLIGYVRPRPNQSALDALDGFRDPIPKR